MTGFTFITIFFSIAFLIRFFIAKEGAPGRTACLVAFFFFALYSSYEVVYIPQWLKTIDGAPIRADLFLFVPALIVIGGFALVQCFRQPED
jgi:hypothetical protein